jgi:KDEL-tailed cysteine endopeptidase
MVKIAVVGISAVAAVEDWATWKDTYGKNYNGDESERQAIFEDNVAFILAENAQELSYTLDTNQFSDLTQDEFKSQYLTRKEAGASDSPSLGVHEWEGEPLLGDIDWKSNGAVTGIKDQKDCGGCWAFSATGALEGANFVANHKLVPLSEQQFLDCDTVDEGCGGGLEYDGWNFFKNKKEGICTETSYPFKNTRKSRCALSSCTLGIQAGQIAGINHVGKTANALKSALNKQPVSVGIEADQRAFQSYKRGVLKGACGKTLDHSVLAVGYGTDKVDGSYWKIKNSWGTTVGESGYYRIAREAGDKCGILDDASFPTVHTSSVEV